MYVSNNLLYFTVVADHTQTKAVCEVKLGCYTSSLTNCGAQCSSASGSVSLPICDSANDCMQGADTSLEVEGDHRDTAGLLGKVSVEMFPGKLLLRVAPRLERWHCLRGVKVGAFLSAGSRCLGHVDILLGHHHALLKKEFVDAVPFLSID